MTLKEDGADTQRHNYFSNNESYEPSLSGGDQHVNTIPIQREESSFLSQEVDDQAESSFMRDAISNEQEKLINLVRVDTPQLTITGECSLSQEQNSLRILDQSRHHGEFLSGQYESLPQHASPVVGNMSKLVDHKYQKSPNQGVPQTTTMMYGKNFSVQQPRMFNSRGFSKPTSPNLKKTLSTDLRLKVTVIPSNRLYSGILSKEALAIQSS